MATEGIFDASLVLSQWFDDSIEAWFDDDLVSSGSTPPEPSVDDVNYVIFARRHHRR